MKKILLYFLTFSITLLSEGQSSIHLPKYPSLFWEITGNGLSRPSYLFGTMHVSSKMVFHLPDSFYLGIKNVDVVALETNPESWQEDLVKYDLDGNSYRNTRYFRQMPDDYLNIRTLQFNRYEKQIEAALYSRPSTINNLLYRNYSEYSSDFEENTYLDMYIYQVGKKMGKRITGVEKYDESMKLMMEAYRDAAKDRGHRKRSFDNEDAYSADKMQEAYRTGNLDLLDSINKFNSFSDAFDEKFLYQRNLLQANSIDSVLKTSSSLFVGVGAAHLPGNRGVIEILRRRGYKLRPILMGERDSRQKDLVEKLRVPVNFTTQVSEDGFFKCDIPGKFYRFNEEGVLNQLQYADMANGSYYMVTRIKTNSRFWGETGDIVKKKVDSLLYENIPGKIISNQPILRNGYNGVDIINRTRRGDAQRYNIFITPYEVIIFKMSGNGSYVIEGDESKRFFGSIQLMNYENGHLREWKEYQPPCGGFAVSLPHEPFISKNSNWQFETEEKSTGTNYTIIRTDIHNYGFAEEDTFDLGLLDESFSGSEFIEKQLSRKIMTWKGYPALESKYLHKDGSILLTRFIIQGPHYYTLVAQGKKELPEMLKFLNSFEIRPFIYNTPLEKKDTSLFYTVQTSFYPEDKKIKLSIPGNENSSPSGSGGENDDNDSLGSPSSWGSFRNNIIEDDTTGEKIYVSFYRNGRYYFNDDSASIFRNKIVQNGSWVIRRKYETGSPGNWRVTEMELSDTNSSRMIRTKSYYKNGISYFLATEGDTLTKPSSFVKGYFETFTPSGLLEGINPFEKKSKVFFNDFFSSDTLKHKRASGAIDQVDLDSADFPQLRQAILAINWSEKKYLEIKKSLIHKLADITTHSASDYLKDLYYAAGDTIELQYAALESLLQQKSEYSFSVFGTIISAEPPVLDASSNSSHNEFNLNRLRFNLSSRIFPENIGNGDFWDELYDSLKLTKSILPAVLPLVNLDDYKWKTMRLLARMVDSNFVAAKDFESYFSKFFIEARQELRKQGINEKKRLIKMASDRNVKEDEDDDDDDLVDYGNEKLGLYARLLLPFWNVNAGVPSFFQQLLQSNDKKLKYSTMLIMIRNNRSVPDSMLNYFANMDDYRYELYKDLTKAKHLAYFPGRYNNQLDLAKSKLLDSKSYGKPDSILFLDKLTVEYKLKKGYIYFFKYKESKDDPGWKLATAGLISKDPKQFEVADNVSSISNPGTVESDLPLSYRSRYDFTSFTDARLNKDEPVVAQLKKQLKKMFYSRRKSAKEFYEVANTPRDQFSVLRFRN